MTQAGQLFPSFSLESDSAGPVSSEALRGTRYVLFVYPKDDTYG